MIDSPPAAHGVVPGVACSTYRKPSRSILARIGRRLQRYFRRYFQRRNHVYVHRGPFEPEHPKNCTFVCYAQFADVPAAVRAAIIANGGQNALDLDEQEMQAGSLLWVAFVGDDVAGVRHVRRASGFHKWFVLLDRQDIVIFRGRTFPEFRGHGISPSMMRHIMYSLLRNGGAAYVDVRIYNHSSIRAIEKAGFVRVGTMKPIDRVTAIAPAKRKLNHEQ